MAFPELHSESGDYDLTTTKTVLTDTPHATLNMLCFGYVQLGDGVKDLSGAGGEFELTITVDDQVMQPAPQLITFGTDVRSGVFTAQFPVPAGAEVTFRLKSPDANDTDVTVTSMLYDAQPLALPDIASNLEGGLAIVDANLRVAANVESMAAGVIVEGTFGAGAITSTVLAADSITTTQLATGAITAATFAANAITSTVLASNAITESVFATDAISARVAANDFIGASEIATGAVQEIADLIANDLIAGDVTALAQAQATLGALLPYLQLMIRDDAAIKTDRAAQLALINADEGSGVGDFDNEQNALEAIAGVTVSGGDAIQAKQDDIIAHLVDVKGAGWVAADNLHDLTGSLTIVANGVAAVLVDTDELQISLAGGGVINTLLQNILGDTNEVQVSLAVAGSTYNVLAAILEDTAAFTSGGGGHDAEVAQILADTNELQVLFAALVTTDDDGPLFTAHALSLAPTTLGAGSETVVLTTNDDNGQAIGGTDVWVTTDAEGTTIVANHTTDTFGRATFYLDPGVYYRWAQRAGYTFTNPKSFSVAESE